MLALAWALAVIADSALVRSGLASILRGSGAVEVVATLTPAEARELDAVGLDLVVRDVSRAASAEEALAQLPRELSVFAVVDSAEQARELVFAGARGVVLRSAPSEQLETASAAVATGLRAFDEE